MTDMSYFASRAEHEFAHTRSATNENAARAHMIMAVHYLDIAQNGYESWLSARPSAESR